MAELEVPSERAKMAAQIAAGFLAGYIGDGQTRTNELNLPWVASVAILLAEEILECDRRTPSAVKASTKDLET